jgi:hypothetical protein
LVLYEVAGGTTKVAPGGHDIGVTSVAIELLHPEPMVLLLGNDTDPTTVETFYRSHKKI